MAERKGLIRVTTPEGDTAYAGFEQLESLKKKGWKVGSTSKKKITEAMAETLRKEQAARDAEAQAKAEAPSIKETKSENKLDSVMKKVAGAVEARKEEKK